MEWLINTWYGITLIVVLSVSILLILSSVFYRQFFKRFYDILLSGLAIIILLPFFIIFTPIVAIAMHGNPFFTQERPGKNEKLFKLIKYRSMNNKKDEYGNLLSDEDRLTKFGRIIRKTSLDELPELFNIFIGTMSIVGPRPQLRKDIIFMNENQRKRHILTPGLTGYAQVNGRNNISWNEKINLDLVYIEKISFIFDIKIILKTVIKVFKGADIDREGTLSDLDYGDWLLKNKYIDKKYYEQKINDLKR